MSDLQTPPTLPDAYVAHNAQASDQAAYDQAMARLASQQPQQGQIAPGQQQSEPKPAQPTQPQQNPQEQADRESMIGAEVARLGSDPEHRQRYGSPTDMRQAAITNLGLPTDPTLSDKIGEVADTLPNALAGKGAQIGHAAGDIAYGSTFELLKSVYAGAHGAVSNVLKMADDLDAWSTAKLNDWHLTALNAEIGHDRGAGLLSGYHLLSGQEAQAAKDAGTAAEGSAGNAFDSAANAIPIIGGEPKTTTGTVIKNVSQFITGMMFAGKQLQALSLPTNMAGWLGRGVTAAQGFGEQIALEPADAVARFLGATRALETEAAIRGFGLIPVPAGVRHFLPPLDEAAMRNPPILGPDFQGSGWELRWLFDGFRGENMSRYVWTVSEGTCLLPDLPTMELGAYDPDLPVRHADIAGIMIEIPGRDPYPCVKHIQERDGKLWACSNDGDLPLSEHTRVVGRLVMALTPITQSPRLAAA